MAKIPPPPPPRKPAVRALPLEVVKSLKADEAFLRKMTAPKGEKK